MFVLVLGMMVMSCANPARPSPTVPTLASVPTVSPVPTISAVPTASPVPETPVGSCPSFDPNRDLSLSDPVILSPDLVKEVAEAIRHELKDQRTIGRLEIADAGEAVEIVVDPEGSGDRLTGPRQKLSNGWEVYRNIHLWGSATFADGSEVGFQLYANPVMAGAGCAIPGVAIHPSDFVPL